MSERRRLLMSQKSDSGLVPGLYDANDNLIATYEDSGLIADRNYMISTYKDDSGSGYSTMDRYRYSYCRKIILPNYIQRVGNNAFRDCNRLWEVIIQHSVTSINTCAFSSCTGLHSITIPNSVTSIGDRAFGSCTVLPSITIPNSVTSIDSAAFHYCTALANIYICKPTGSISGAPWSASYATVTWNYTP